MPDTSPTPSQVVKTPPQNNMVYAKSFIEILPKVLEDKKIHKLEWQNRGFWGEIRAGVLVLHKPDGKYYEWIIGEGDFIGNDWIVLD